MLALVREGLANKQIARRLGITERTVKAHLTSIFATIGVARPNQRGAVGGAASGLTRFSGTGGGVPPHAGQTALNEHQSQARDRLRLPLPRLVGQPDGLPQRVDLALGGEQVVLVGLVAHDLAVAEVDRAGAAGG